MPRGKVAVGRDSRLGRRAGLDRGKGRARRGHRSACRLPALEPALLWGRCSAPMTIFGGSRTAKGPRMDNVIRHGPIGRG